jgi:hypothetical protein
MKSAKPTTSTTGFRPSGLDTVNLKGILELCVSFGVSRIKTPDFEVEFQASRLGILPVPAPETSIQPVKEITDKEHRAQTAQSLEDDEVSLREQQIADLQLTDPRAAEEMILNGDLDDLGHDDEREPG